MSTVNCRIVLDFERPSKELLEKFKELPVATLDDSMNRMSAMDSGIHAYSKGKLAGPAFTIKVPYGDNLMLHKSVDMIKPGDILVIQCENSLNRAIFGSLLVNNLKEKGARGIIVDGAIRDSEEISQIEGIPVYARCTSPNGPWKNGPGEINTTIAVGGQIVRPGDIVCADQDGIVVVPQEYAKEIAAETKEKEEGEKVVLAQMLAGKFERPWVEQAMEKLKVDVKPR